MRWSLPIPAAPSAPPVIAGERLFLATLPGLVVAHDLKDGRELWRAAVHPDQPVVVDGDRLFVAAGEAVQALQVSDGAAVWRAPTGTLTAPLIVRDGWVIASAGTRLLALREADGSIVWQRETAPQRERGAIDGNTLFVSLQDGRLMALNLATGATLWELRLKGAPAEPIVVGERLYVGATDKSFYCVKTSSGEIDWPIRVGAEVRSRASSDGERVYYAGLDNLVRAVSRGSGAQRWQQGVPFRPFVGPAVAGGFVLVAGPATDVLMLQAKNGTPAGKVTFPEALVVTPAIATGPAGEVLVAGVTGGLNESWKLWLASPAPAKPTAPPAR